MIFALIGNQNCGKTTLFNQITGANQHVGNFPGVTVDQTMGSIRGQEKCSVVDLPGIYSIRPYSAEEIITRDFLLNSKPDGIINIVDATNIERNLYLTLQLLELHIPTVIALNMMDEMRENGGSVDVEKLSETLGVDIVPISALKNEGVDELIKAAVSTVKKRRLPAVTDFCSTGPIHRAIHSIAHQIEDHAENNGISPRFAATKVIEGDEDIIRRLDLTENELDGIEHSIVEMEEEYGLDRHAAMAEMRYTFIERVCGASVIKAAESKERKRSVKIDRILTNKYLSIPIFIGAMLLIFWLTFDVVGDTLSGLLEQGIGALTIVVDGWLKAYGINPIVNSLVIDGIFTGVGSVLTFLPYIVTLFFFLSILEDSGYMARIAFVMDKILRKIGLSGRSIVPLLIGFGCTVPAAMATRTLSSKRDQRFTVMLIPFMSCSAKIPIYTVFAAAFFDDNKWLVMSCLYLFGMAMGIIVALVLKTTHFKGKPIPFIMELPNYRLPSLKSVVLLMWEKAKDFLQRAFTIIFVATIIIWFLQSFDAKLNPVSDSADSLLAMIGRFIAPVFAPMGFGDWRISTALISGFTAKEAVVSTLEVLMSSGTTLATSLAGLFSTASAAALSVFTLLYTPCVAAVATINRELGSKWKTVGVVFMQCAIAWAAAFLVFQVFSI